MKRLHKTLAYALVCLVRLKELAKAVNIAESPEQLDKLVLSINSGILSE